MNGTGEDGRRASVAGVPTTAPQAGRNANTNSAPNLLRRGSMPLPSGATKAGGDEHGNAGRGGQKSRQGQRANNQGRRGEAIHLPPQAMPMSALPGPLPPLVVLSVETKKGRVEMICVYPDDVPRQLAERFCQTHRMEEVVDALTHHIAYYQQAFLDAQRTVAYM